MSRLWITGYRSYELGIFKKDDPKKIVIDKVIKDNLSQEIMDGVNWIITGGHLGIEQWSVENAEDLKKTFPDEFQTAVMLPFENFGEQWKDENKLELQKCIQSANFSANVSNEKYQSPMQLKAYQKFMLSHTDKALLIYDLDNEGKTKYDYKEIKKYAENHDYNLKMISFDDLQEAANEYENSLKDFPE
ncbi:DUF1273 domain-containing protein [Apilactobacillus apisilvae]|uniref:UPF0398 protein MOO46_01885 n=1 Tax=Apilactobacillus apisilvae TaxID=2923364 RepID=A0ABY4PIN1_9LACO|nr:DUF1273 domain-containing protein [Apilactobacillus apisilvae]UQS85365.1 DUF1273 domain-containing protein [Apilactobacillus apisilvae]